MPLEVLVNLKDGKKKIYYIPITLMRGEKENPYNIEWSVLKDWPWAFPEYGFVIDENQKDIESIVIDPTMYMADINRNNNEFPASK